MNILSCEACGGALEQLDDNVYICTYCGTKQLISNDSRADKPKDRAPNPHDKYIAACYAHAQAKNSNDYLRAARLFEEIKLYKGSAELMRECRDKAIACQKDEIYDRAVKLMSEGTPHFLTLAAELFASISEWKNSETLKEKCLSEISRFNEQINERNQRVKKRHAKERRRSTAKLIIIVLIILIAYLSLIFIFN